MHAEPPPRRLRTGTLIVLGTLLVAGLYLVVQLVVNRVQGVGTTRVLQFIAAAVLGPEAFRGGKPTALLGLALHGLVSLSVTAVFVLTARRVRWLREHPVWSGLIYGVLVYAVMTGVVMPLSALPFSPGTRLLDFAAGVAVHVGCVGWPLAFLVAWYGAPRA